MDQKSEAVQLVLFLKWAAIVFCVVAPLAAYQSCVNTKQQEAARREAMKPERMLDRARADFRQYAGAACESRVKRELRDPDSARILSTAEPLLTDSGNAAFVVVTVAAKNGFGGTARATFGCSLRRVDGSPIPRVDAITTISDGD